MLDNNLGVKGGEAISEALKVNTSHYNAARSMIERAVATHKATLRTVPNQIKMGGNPSLKVCCDSTKNCNCNPENLAKNVFVCDGSNDFDDGGTNGYCNQDVSGVGEPMPC